MAESASTKPATTSGTEPLPLPLLPQDWDRQATDKVIGLVDQVRIKSSGPAIVAARSVVFGLVGAIAAVLALILLIIGLVRLMNIGLEVWVTYLILGSVFTAVGAFLWSKRPRHAAS